MPEKIHEVKIKIRGTKDYLKTIKDNLAKIFTEEVSPEMYQSIRDVFLYRNMPVGLGKKIDTFMSSHAGLFSAAVVKNMKTNSINFASKNTNAIVEQPGGQQELILSFAVSKEVADKLEQANKDPEAIFNLITRLDDATAKDIFEKALKEMENK